MECPDSFCTYRCTDPKMDKFLALIPYRSSPHHRVSCTFTPDYPSIRRLLSSAKWMHSSPRRSQHLKPTRAQGLLKKGVRNSMDSWNKSSFRQHMLTRQEVTPCSTQGFSTKFATLEHQKPSLKAE